MTTGSARDAGSPPGCLISTEFYQADSTNTLDLDSIPTYTTRYTCLLDESVSGSSLDSDDYQHPANNAPPYPTTCAPLKPRSLTPLAASILGSPSFESDSSPILITSPKPAYVKAIPKLSDIDHIDIWLNFTTSQVQLDLDSVAVQKKEEDWVPEGSLYNPVVFKSRLSLGHARVADSGRPAWSRCPTPSERLEDSLHLDSAVAESATQSPHKTASYDDLLRRRKALVFNATLIEAPTPRSRRWSYSSRSGALASREGATNKVLSICSSGSQNSNHHIPDYLTQAIPMIKLSNSEHTLAISIPSTVPSSDRFEPDRSGAHTAALSSLADRRGKPIPEPLALQRPIDTFEESYPSLPTAFMFSPTTATGDVNPFLPTERLASQIMTGRDTHDMIKQLQEVASQLKPTTPVDLTHKTSTNECNAGIEGAESQSNNSLASFSLHHSNSDVNVRSLSMISEDEWGFARELMNATGDPLPPKSLKDKSDAIPPVPKIPIVLKVAALRSTPAPTGGSASRLPKANARISIPQAPISRSNVDSTAQTPARSSLKKLTGIQLPSRRVPSPVLAASPNPNLPGAPSGVTHRPSLSDANKSGPARTPTANHLLRKAPAVSNIARSSKTASAQKPERPTGPAPTSAESTSRMPVRSGVPARRPVRSTLPAMPIAVSTAPKSPPSQPQPEIRPSPAASKNLSTAEEVFSSPAVDAPIISSPSPPVAAPMYTSVSDSAALPLPSSPTALSDSDRRSPGNSPRPRGILKHRKKVWWDDAQNVVTAIPDLVADSTLSPEDSALPTPEPVSPRTPTLSWRKIRTQSVMLRGSPSGGENARRRSFAAPSSHSDSALDTPSERAVRRAFSFNRSGSDKESAGKEDKENRFRFSLGGTASASSKQTSSQNSTESAKKPSFMSLLGKLRA